VQVAQAVKIAFGLAAALFFLSGCASTPANPQSQDSASTGWDGDSGPRPGLTGTAGTGTSGTQGFGEDGVGPPGSAGTGAGTAGGPSGTP